MKIEILRFINYPILPPVLVPRCRERGMLVGVGGREVVAVVVALPHT